MQQKDLHLPDGSDSLTEGKKVESVEQGWPQESRQGPWWSAALAKASLYSLADRLGPQGFRASPWRRKCYIIDRRTV